MKFFSNLVLYNIHPFYENKNNTLPFESIDDDVITSKKLKEALKVQIKQNKSRSFSWNVVFQFYEFDSRFFNLILDISDNLCSKL